MNINDIKVTDNPLNYLLYLKYFYKKKFFIISLTSIFIIVGVIYSLSIDPEYKSSTIIVPQSNDNKNNYGSLGNLASIAGLNIDNISSSVDISPNLYPMLLSNITFLKKIINKKIITSKENEKITFKEYFSSTDKNAFSIKELILTPIINILSPENKLNINDFDTTSDYIISKEEKLTMDVFENRISLEIFPLDGYIEITGIMPEAIAAREIVSNTRIQLQEEIISFKIKKAESKLKFLIERLKDVKKTYDKKKSILAKFKEENKSINSIYQQNKLDELIAENNLSFTLYSDLNKQIENQRIKVKEETPVFTIIKEAVVPLERFKPKRKSIVINFMIVGFLTSIFLIIFKPLFDNAKKIILKKY
tara:strand:+ start:2409 stop:3500 length:1092 start_codon:yes stop_codon:yes gene_type:complete